MLMAHNNCNHFWMLDHKIYFNPKKELVNKKTGERIVPVKCHMCKDDHSFTKQEWLEHLGEFNS